MKKAINLANTSWNGQWWEVGGAQWEGVNFLFLQPLTDGLGQIVSL